MRPQPSPKRDQAIELLKAGAHSQKALQLATGAHQVTVAAWFRSWVAADRVRIVGRGEKPRRGVTPLLWVWKQ